MTRAKKPLGPFGSVLADGLNRFAKALSGLTGAPLQTSAIGPQLQVCTHCREPITRAHYLRHHNGFDFHLVCAGKLGLDVGGVDRSKCKPPKETSKQ